VPPERATGAQVLRLPWQLIGFVAPLALAATLGVAWFAYQRADAALERAAEAHLRAVRSAAEASVTAELERRRATVRRLAVDARSGAALAAFAAATRASESDQRLETAAAAPLRATLLARLQEMIHPTRPEIDIATFMPPSRRALWLQTQYLAGTADSATGAYADAHAQWHAWLADQAAQAGFADLLLVRAADGTVVYDVAKTPIFQTSLLDGPFADSSLGTLFRHVRVVPEAGAVRLADFAPFLPAAGAAQAFVGAPLLTGEAIDGVLIAAFEPGALTRALTSGGDWDALGLGSSGDLFLFGPDGRLRSEPRQHAAFERPSASASSTAVIAPPALVHARPDAEALTSFARADGVLMTAAVGPSFGELGWRAVATIDAADARHGAARLGWQLALAALAVSALLVAALAAVGWWLAVPFAHLAAALGRIRPSDPKSLVPVLGGGDAAALAVRVNRLLSLGRDEAAKTRRARAGEAQALATVVDSWRAGDRAPRAYAGGELAALALALNALAEQVDARMPSGVSDATQAAATSLRAEATRQLAALEAAVAAAQRTTDAAQRINVALRAAGADGRQAEATAHAAASAAARVGELLRRAGDADTAAWLTGLDEAASCGAALADELAVLAVNTMLSVEHGERGDDVLGGAARDAAERAASVHAQLQALRGGSVGSAAIAESTVVAGDAERETQRAAQAVAQQRAEIDALVAASDALDGVRSGDSLRAAQAAASRFAQAAEVLLRELAVVAESPTDRAIGV